MEIAVTMLSSYLYCKRKLFLEKVLMIVEPPKKSLVLGSIRHSLYEHINDVEKTVVSSITTALPIDKISTLYKKRYLRLVKQQVLSRRKQLRDAGVDMVDAFQGSWNQLSKEADVRAKAVSDFMKESGCLGDELWQHLTPKIRSEIMIRSEGLGLRGAVDQILDYPDYVVPVELKTGRIPKEGVWPGHKIQIGAYMMMLEKDHSVTKGVVRYLDCEEKREVRINPFFRQELTQLRNAVESLLSSVELPGKCASFKCTSCGLQDKCHDEELMKGLVNRLKAHTKPLNTN